MFDWNIYVKEKKGKEKMDRMDKMDGMEMDRIDIMGRNSSMLFAGSVIC
jgi:hypothetical protein